MKILLNIGLLSALLVVPAAAQVAKPQAVDAMNCPMSGGAMRQNIGSMMMEMDAMMSDTSDPALKVRMQKMHDRMAMMRNGMHGGGMMGPADAEDHKAHHPN